MPQMIIRCRFDVLELRDQEWRKYYMRASRAISPGSTDQEIQKWISRQHAFVPESAWLLHCKEQFGPAVPGTAPKENPCPPENAAARFPAT